VGEEEGGGSVAKQRRTSTHDILASSRFAETETDIALIVHGRRVWKLVGLEGDGSASLVVRVLKVTHDLVVDWTPVWTYFPSSESREEEEEGGERASLSAEKLR
jgi:hypothetical protein